MYIDTGAALPVRTPIVRKLITDPSRVYPHECIFNDIIPRRCTGRGGVGEGGRALVDFLYTNCRIDYFSYTHFISILKETVWSW